MAETITLRVGRSRIELTRGDITKIPVDAIVNAANSSLMGGGGVDGAIHAAGGPSLMRELDEIRASIGRCQTGSAVVTTAGRLPATYVFHTVGPVYQGGNHNEAALLASCYSTCLTLARQYNAQTISFPSISTGIYGYPITEAADIALRTAIDRLTASPEPPLNVILVQFSDRDFAVYKQQSTRLEADSR